MSLSADQVAKILADQQKQFNEAQQVQQKQFSKMLIEVISKLNAIKKESNCSSPQSFRSNAYSFLQGNSFTDSSTQPPSPCLRCGGMHWTNECKSAIYPRHVICHKCQQPGHIASKCRTRASASRNTWQPRNT